MIFLINLANNTEFNNEQFLYTVLAYICINSYVFNLKLFFSIVQSNAVSVSHIRLCLANKRLKRDHYNRKARITKCSVRLRRITTTKEFYPCHMIRSSYQETAKK